MITSLGAAREVIDAVHSYGGVVFHDVRGFSLFSVREMIVISYSFCNAGHKRQTCGEGSGSRRGRIDRRMS